MIPNNSVVNKLNTKPEHASVMLLKFIVLIASVLFLNASFAQSHNNNRIYIPVMCGAGPQTAPQVDSFKNMVSNKAFVLIQKKLFDGSAIDQILSAIVLKQYHKDKVLKLSRQEIRKIRQVSNSKKKFTVCFTCLFRQQGKVKQLFHKKKFVFSYEIIRLYIIDQFPVPTYSPNKV